MKITIIFGKYFNSWEALGCGYIGAYLKKKLPSCVVNFFHGNFDSDEQVISGSLDSDIILFSATTPTYKYCVDIARKIKLQNKNVHCTLGGYHASAVKEEALVDGIIDQVVVGEGESAVVDIVKGNREKVIYGERMLFSDLPWPDRELIKNERNIQVAFNDTGKNITSFQSHRACPFRCKYCLDGYSSVMYPTKGVFERSINNLLDEMEFVSQKYKLDLLKFCDATWNVNKQYVKRFCMEKINRRFNLPYFANIHANVVDEKMFEFMKKSNCLEIGIGIESGSERILKNIGKNTNKKSIKHAVTLAKENDIFVRGYFILGMPGETEEDLKMTEEFAEELELGSYGFTILCPYPGTKMYLDSNGEFKNIVWESTDEYINYFWDTGFVSNEKLRFIQDSMVKKFSNKVVWRNKIILNDSKDK